MTVAVAKCRACHANRGGLALVARLGPVVAASVRVAGAAPGDIHRHSARQAWYLVTSTVSLRGRRGTYSTGLALVARLGPVVASAVAATPATQKRRWMSPSTTLATI